MRAVLASMALCLAASLVTPRDVHANIPSAALSFVTAHVVICPAGDSMLVVVARTASGTPFVDGPIWVETCDCPGLQLGPPPVCSSPDGTSCHVVMVPDVYGIVQIPISGGGLCPGGSLRVLGNGVLLAILPEPACFDQNGDLKVDEVDVSIVQSKIGSHDPGADFDGDGTVTAQDLAILQAHLGHASP